MVTERRTLIRAGVRLALGTAQITGASTALVSLIQTGPRRLTMITTVVTAGFTIASRVIFRGGQSSRRTEV
jgi:hypothetical protein